MVGTFRRCAARRMISLTPPGTASPSIQIFKDEPEPCRAFDRGCFAPCKQYGPDSRGNDGSYSALAPSVSEARKRSLAAATALCATVEARAAAARVTLLASYSQPCNSSRCSMLRLSGTAAGSGIAVGPVRMPAARILVEERRVSPERRLAEISRLDAAVAAADVAMADVGRQAAAPAAAGSEIVDVHRAILQSDE